MNQRCWLCLKAIANTGEHYILKNSNYKMLYGKGNIKYTADDQPYHFKNGRTIKPKSSGDSELKILNSLCKTCNDTTTQPHDIAFDNLFKEIVINKNNKFSPAPNQLVLVYGYFLKIISCKLFSKKMKVPNEFRKYILEQKKNSKLSFSMSVLEELTNIEVSYNGINFSETEGFALIVRGPLWISLNYNISSEKGNQYKYEKINEFCELSSTNISTTENSNFNSESQIEFTSENINQLTNILYNLT
jgi:hypothetical protein